MPANSLVNVGVIGRPHGVKGLVHIQTNMENPHILEEVPYLQDSLGNRWLLKWHGKGYRIASLKRADQEISIVNRDQASSLTLRHLYVSRDFLPPVCCEEYYLADLLHMRVFEGDEEIGQIVEIYDYGAGVFLELSDKRLIPFNRASVPVINLEKHYLKINPPEMIDSNK